MGGCLLPWPGVSLARGHSIKGLCQCPKVLRHIAGPQESGPHQDGMVQLRSPLGRQDQGLDREQWRPEAKKTQSATGQEWLPACLMLCPIMEEHVDTRPKSCVSGFRGSEQKYSSLVA